MNIQRADRTNAFPNMQLTRSRPQTMPGVAKHRSIRGTSLITALGSAWFMSLYLLGTSTVTATGLQSVVVTGHAVTYLSFNDTDTSTSSHIRLTGHDDITVSVAVPAGLAAQAVPASYSKVTWAVREAPLQWEEDVVLDHALTERAPEHAKPRHDEQAAESGFVSDSTFSSRRKLLQSSGRAHVGADGAVNGLPSGPRTNVSNNTATATQFRTLVVFLGFRSNSGQSVLYHPCGAECAKAMLWDDSPSVAELIADNSGGAATLSAATSIITTVTLSVFASTPTCATASYEKTAAALLQATQSVNVNDYAFRVYVLPANAGGGACSPWQTRASFACVHAGMPCTMFVRTANVSHWIQGFAAHFGIAPAQASEDVVGTHGVGDPTDASALAVGRPNATTWRRFNALNQFRAGWLFVAAVRERPLSPPMTSMVIVSASSPGPLLGTKIVLVHAGSVAGNTTWWLSMRDEGGTGGATTTSLDRFLAPPWVNKVYVHRATGIMRAGADGRSLPPSPSVLVAVLPVGGVFTEHSANLHVTVVSIANGAAVLEFRPCVQKPPLAVITSPVPMFADAMKYPALSRVNVTIQYSNLDRFCAPQSATVLAGEPTYLAADTATTTHPSPSHARAALTCNEITVVLVPDFNILEISYTVETQLGVVVLSGGAWSNSTIFCGAYNETLVAKFRDIGGDGYCCRYGGQSYYELLVGGTSVARGGEFRFAQDIQFYNRMHWRVSMVASGNVATSKSVFIIPPDAPARATIALPVYVQAV